MNKTIDINKIVKEVRANNILTHKHTNTQIYNNTNTHDLRDKSGVLTPPLPLDLDSRGGVASQETPAWQEDQSPYWPWNLEDAQEQQLNRNNEGYAYGPLIKMPSKPLQENDIAYISATLKTPKEDSPQRRDLNIDFKLVDGVIYNKLVFDLVASIRRREILANLRAEDSWWHGYKVTSECPTKDFFVGKGRRRLSAEKGQQKRSPIQLFTAAKLHEPTMTLDVYIEDAYFELHLEPFEDKRGIFCAKGWHQNVKQQNYDLGGWR